MSPVAPRESAPVPKHFYSLDALRGVAALSVVFWHWQHFFYTGETLGPNFIRDRQPFYSCFSILYNHGWIAVDLFFCLSGFVLFYLYSERIRRRETTASEFAVWRFSRLYPLHVATLILVLLLQLYYHGRFGEYFCYRWNDAYHFTLNLAFASEWGLQRGLSFNAPIWSVSIEVLLYALFFVAMCAKLRRWHLAVVLASALLLAETGPHFLRPIARAAFLFFLGGFCHAFYRSVIVSRFKRIPVAGILLLLLSLWILIPLNQEKNFLLHALERLRAGPILLVGGKDAGSFLVHKVTAYSVSAVLFPATLVGLALLETVGGRFWKKTAFLGQLSYSCYLLHFPLQLAFVLIGSALGFTYVAFYSPGTLVLFFVVLIPLSLLSYHAFEKPIQDRIRRVYRDRVIESEGFRKTEQLAPAARD